MAVSGCPRNCAEATIKDIGVVCVDSGYEICMSAAMAASRCASPTCCARSTTEDEVLEYAGAFMQLYREEAHYLERTAPWIDAGRHRLCQERLVEDAEGRARPARPLPAFPAIRADRSLGRTRRRRRRARIRRSLRGGWPMIDDLDCWIDVGALDRHPARGARAGCARHRRATSPCSAPATTGSSPCMDAARTRAGRCRRASSTAQRHLPAAQLGDRPGDRPSAADAGRGLRRTDPGRAARTAASMLGAAWR